LAVPRLRLVEALFQLVDLLEEIFRPVVGGRGRGGPAAGFEACDLVAQPLVLLEELLSELADFDEDLEELLTLLERVFGVGHSRHLDKPREFGPVVWIGFYPLPVLAAR